MTGGGDVDMAAVGQLLADRGRCRILLALADGRALPASVLAAEAGVRASTASGHPRKLTERGLIEVLATGRSRYYRLASPDVARLVEVIARLAPAQPVRSAAANEVRRERTMVSDKVHAVLPEWEGFAHAVQARRPDAGTWCEGWTVRDVLIHNTGNAEEFARVLRAHLAGEPVRTRGFEEREGPYRAMADAELWSAFVTGCERLIDVSEAAARDLPPDTEIGWTGRWVTPGFFAEHMREEMVLHRWDMTGDDATAVHSLMQPWMTEHSVHDVGKPLLVRGSAGLDLGPHDRVEGRLRSPGTDDILLTATERANTIELVPQEGEATIESDPAVRALFLWGRRPSDPSRWHSQAGPDALRRLRTLLSGY